MAVCEIGDLLQNMQCVIYAVGYADFAALQINFRERFAVNGDLNALNFLEALHQFVEGHFFDMDEALGPT